VRNQLQQTYRKTGATRQSELISLILSATAFVATRRALADEAPGPIASDLAASLCLPEPAATAGD